MRPGSTRDERFIALAGPAVPASTFIGFDAILVHAATVATLTRAGSRYLNLPPPSRCDWPARVVVSWFQKYRGVVEVLISGDAQVNARLTGVGG